MLFGDARKVEKPPKRVCCVQESGGGGIDLPPLSALTYVSWFSGERDS